jgi:succinate dehydrogenase / fumarate reductase membrane anchor subunit
MSRFESGRSGKGAAFTSDRSGSLHALAMRHTARAMAPLGILSVWLLAHLAGKPFEAARAELGRPVPALILIAFVVVAAYHARLGVENIVEDYVHDAALKAKALEINKWLMIAVAAVWTLSIMIIAAPR